MTLRSGTAGGGGFLEQCGMHLVLSLYCMHGTQTRPCKVQW